MRLVVLFRRRIAPFAAILFVGFLIFGTYKECVSEVNASMTDYVLSLDTYDRTIR
jgi:hypothetical protein